METDIFQERARERYQFLQKIYNLAGGKHATPVPLNDVLEGIDYPQRRLDVILDELQHDDLVKLITGGDDSDPEILITDAGLKSMESKCMD